MTWLNLCGVVYVWLNMMLEKDASILLSEINSKLEAPTYGGTDHDELLGFELESVEISVSAMEID
jgi:hypothetical protein